MYSEEHYKVEFYVEERLFSGQLCLQGNLWSYKNEMYYSCSWMDLSIEGFIQVIEDYMVWYRETRIKQSLGGMSPLEYRKNLGLCS